MFVYSVLKPLMVAQLLGDSSETDMLAGCKTCYRDSEASRSVLYPTRLETRTKESNMYASRTVLTRLGGELKETGMMCGCLLDSIVVQVS